jgi:acyl carrier protein phosphodiesterase
VLAWVVAGSGLVIALVALALTRRLSRRLDALTQSYWDLRYEYTRLRSQMSRLDPESGETAPTPPPAPAATVSFVPLSTIRKKDR